jgi:hypothetical protein
MILIAHRGNINGPNPEKENHPDYIKSALSQNYDVEVDVWVVDGKYVLGHDAPNYEVEFDFINRNRNLWLHAKNLDALEKMCTEPHLHYFWHQKDDFVVTSKGYIWTYPGNRLGPHSICVLPENVGLLKLTGCAGVCSDFVKKYRGARNSGSVLGSND